MKLGLQHTFSSNYIYVRLLCNVLKLRGKYIFFAACDTYTDIKWVDIH